MSYRIPGLSPWPVSGQQPTRGAVGRGRRSGSAFLVIPLILPLLIAGFVAVVPASASHFGAISGKVSSTGWIGYNHKRCISSVEEVVFRMTDRSTNVTFSHAASRTIDGSGFRVRSWGKNDSSWKSMSVPRNSCFYWNSRKHSNCWWTCYYGDWWGEITTRQR